MGAVRPRLRHAAAPLVALLALALPAAAWAVPSNDLFPGATRISVPAALYGGQTAFGVPSASSAGATRSDSDPDLRDARADSPCRTDQDIQDSNGQGVWTTWYLLALKQRDAPTKPVTDSFVVELDSDESGISHALAVVTGTTSPTSVLRCQIFNPSNDSSSRLSFVARPGVKYWIEVAGLQASAPGDTISMTARATDITGPRLVLTADTLLPQPGTSSTFTLANATDGGSGWSNAEAGISWRALIKRKSSAGSRWRRLPMVVAAGRRSIEVRYPKLAPSEAAGGAEVKVTVTAHDRASALNTSSVTWTVTLKDRKPPKPQVVTTVLSGHRLRTRASCGKLSTVEIIVKHGDGQPFRSWAPRGRRTTFTRDWFLGSSPYQAWVITVICTDVAGNRAGTFGAVLA